MIHESKTKIQICSWVSRFKGMEAHNNVLKALWQSRSPAILQPSIGKKSWMIWKEVDKSGLKQNDFPA
jgi:hypothetical protein